MVEMHKNAFNSIGNTQQRLTTGIETTKATWDQRFASVQRPTVVVSIEQKKFLLVNNAIFIAFVSYLWKKSLNNMLNKIIFRAWLLSLHRKRSNSPMPIALRWRTNWRCYRKNEQNCKQNSDVWRACKVSMNICASSKRNWPRSSLSRLVTTKFHPIRTKIRFDTSK